jgi:hypothetical protein
MIRLWCRSGTKRPSDRRPGLGLAGITAFPVVWSPSRTKRPTMLGSPVAWGALPHQEPCCRNGRRLNRQAFARLNARDAIQTARMANAVVIDTPMATSGLPQSPLNRARAASTA